MSDEAAATEVGRTQIPDGTGLAIDIAMEEARNHSELKDEAAAFLKKQRDVAAIQEHHLKEEFVHVLKQLGLKTWELRLGVLLRIATAFVGIAVATGFAFLIWDASQSSRLLIEPFSVPPDLAARGLTGEVIAAKVLDRFIEIRAQTNSPRANKSFANSWRQQDLQLEIPETGISLAQLDNFLREKVSNDTHVNGEIVRNAAGLVLTARAGAGGADSVAGPEADLQLLVQKLAEAIYGRTQPYLYAIWLGSHGRAEEAAAVFKNLAENGPVEERSWAYQGWGILVRDTEGADRAMELMRQGVEFAPDSYAPLNELATVENNISLSEQALRDFQKAAKLLPGSRNSIRPESQASSLRATESSIAILVGDYLTVAQNYTENARDPYANKAGLSATIAIAQTNAHDVRAARASMANLLRGVAITSLGSTLIGEVRARMLIDIEVQDWAALLQEEKAVDQLVGQYPGLKTYTPSRTTPLLAFAEARLGRFAAAEARIKDTPADCYVCLRVRAAIAELQGQRGPANYWFEQAIKAGPSIPYAYSEWGRVLMQRGDFTGAIAQFKLANQKGPHFADPLEMWGEVLIAQNRSDLAIAKFTEANKYAPNWGRLHLKWGEALSYLGKPTDAQKQFARAGELDLTAAEKAELAKVSK